MKKLLIFIFILIAAVSCNNASKTGTSYNNSSNNNTEQGSNEEGNQTGEDSSTEQGGSTNTGEDDNTDNTIKTDNDWKNKLSGRRIQNGNTKYEFDKDSNIYVNQETEIRWTFVKYLGNDKALYSENIDPSNMLFNEPSDKIEKIYSILTIMPPNDNIYFLDGYKITSWTENYKIKIRAFYSGNKSEPELADWPAYPHMTEVDLDTTQKGGNWGYLNPVK